MDLKFYDWMDRKSIAHLGGILSRTFRDNSSYLAQLPGSGYAFDERVESWEATVERLNEFFTIRGLL